MGHWEWERGDFKLPTSEFARVRNAVAGADRKQKEAVFEKTQVFWKGLKPKQKNSLDEYRDAAGKAFPDYRGVDGATQRALLQVIHRDDQKPKRVLQADMEYPTNKTLVFHGDDVDIVFDRSATSATYETSDNRHTIENAHSSPILYTLMDNIREMRWTRGTGGRVWSDNEYAQDARKEYGYWSEMTSRAYGPIGAENWPGQSQPWKNPKGESFHVKIVKGKYGVQGRVQKGVRAGGRYSGRYRPESEVYLPRW